LPIIALLEDDAFRTLSIFGQSWKSKLEVVIAAPAVGLVLLLDLVVFLVLVGHFEECFVVVIDTEGEQVDWSHAIL
jgi:hypothetical protein